MEILIKKLKCNIGWHKWKTFELVKIRVDNSRGTIYANQFCENCYKTRNNMIFPWTH